MPRRDKNQHLLQRHGKWHINKRIAGTSNYYRKSLKTADIDVGRERRDKILLELEEKAQEVETARDIVAIREKYLNAISENEREYIRDQIEDQADDMAIELGVYEQVRGPTPLDELSDDASP